MRTCVHGFELNKKNRNKRCALWLVFVSGCISVELYFELKQYLNEHTSEILVTFSVNYCRTGFSMVC